MICPIKHPRRFAAHVERQQATRAKALSIALSAPQAASRMGISTLRAEQLAARYGFTYQPTRKRP